MRSGGKATLGDALSSEMRTRMQRLRDELEQRARETIDLQLRQPKQPWQAGLAPLGREARFAHAIPTLSSASPPSKSKVVLSSPGGASKPALVRATTGRARQDVPEAEAEPRPVPFEFWELPPEAAVRERPPTTVSSEERDTFEATIAADPGAVESGSGERLYAVIGLDFGTSTTKVMVRFPYEAGSPVFAIPAPKHCLSMKHPYLWQTALWLRNTGEFVPYPNDDAHLLHALKQGIMSHRADVPIDLSGDGSPGVTRAEAAAAFLAFVVRYTRGWLAKHQPGLFQKRWPVWFLHVGVPAANFDDKTLLRGYRRVVATSLLLANDRAPVTVDLARRFLADDLVAAAADSVTDAEKLGVGVTPETAAEAAGFAKSTNTAPGLYLLVDVGAMTLDVCTFKLVQEPPDPDMYSLLAAQVRPLGVDAYHWFVGNGKTDSGFLEQCNRCLWKVVWGTKGTRDPNASAWRRRNALPVFLAGGGARNDMHRGIVEQLDPWLREHTDNEGIHLVPLPMPANISPPIQESDFSRLGVAWGLSFPPNEIGDFFPPSEIDDVPPPPRIDITGGFISKDQV